VIAVYAESNFILEIALEQKEVVQAGAILDLARNGRIGLVVPSFAFCEPFTTLARRRIDRGELGRQIGDQVTQLKRSPFHALDHGRLRHVADILAGISNAQEKRLNATISDLLGVCRRIEFDAGVFADAVRYRDLYGFKTVQDAIIYASVITDLRRRPSGPRRCFVTRNKADFELDPRIRAELDGLGCELKGTFGAAAGYIEHLIEVPVRRMPATPTEQDPPPIP
jgi:hypothetical protein